MKTVICRIMSEVREKYLNVARILKKTDRYKMMIGFMNDIIRIDPKLNAEERNLFSRPYKALINERRDSFRVVSSVMEKEESIASPKMQKYQTLKNKIAL